MPTYRYVAKDQTGRTASGTLEADDEQAAGRALRDQGLWPLRVEATRPATTASTATPVAVPAARRRGEWHVSLFHLSVYFHRLAAAVRSGMPIGRCLEVMAQQSRGPLSRISLEAQAAVNRGQPLSSVLARHPRVFSPLVLAMVRAGERGGFLDIALQRIAETLESQYQLRQTIRRETAYPKMLLGAALLIPIAVRLIVSNLAGNNTPGGVSTLGNTLWATFLPLAVLVAALLLINRVASGTAFLDGVKWHLPLVGKVVRNLALARLTRALASLYRAGVPYGEAVTMAAEASGNAFVSSRLRQVLPTVQRGQRLSVALARSGLLPPMAMNMLITGEETGNVDAMLDKVADYAESEATTACKVMTSMLTPLLVLIIGVAIASEVFRFYTGLFGSYLTTPE